ncbi:hypothetical protein [Rubripirellula lacrimiformis]|nr:hypothetical protein [Rubripirellula lacrimiformis]
MIDVFQRDPEMALMVRRRTDRAPAAMQLTTRPIIPGRQGRRGRQRC